MLYEILDLVPLNFYFFKEVENSRSFVVRFLQKQGFMI